jgi:Zn-dependent protease
MESALRIGKFGPLTIHLNHTWLFAAVLILWWTALDWLPNQFPNWNSRLYWLAAVIVLFLFGLSVVAHELVHTALARSGPRQVNLFPFGAAVPLRLGQVEIGRATISALGGLIFNLVLGGLLLWLGGGIGDTEGLAAFVKAVLVPLGTLNLALGLVNLIPGIPFDAGWALASGIAFVSGDHEAGLKITRTIGGIAAVTLVLFGAWRGLLNNSWLEALALVVTGWAAREAGAIGQHRSTLRTLLGQMKAGDFMEPIRPGDEILASATVAEMVNSHPNILPNLPLPVVDEHGPMVGITTMAATERLLQGTWPITPVRALTVPIEDLRVVRSNTPLIEVMEVVQAQKEKSYRKNGEAKDKDSVQAPEEEETYIPVVDDGKLVGSINPDTLTAFERAGRQFGIEESLVARPRGALALLGSLLPVLAVLTTMAILGSIALRTEPTKLPDVVGNGDDTITLANYNPADGDIIGLGEQEISVEVAGSSPIVSATIAIDGQPLETQMSGSSPLTQTVTARLPGLTLGVHTARISAIAENGDRKSDTWQFRVSSRVEEEPTPTQVVVAQQFEIVRYRPALGGRVPAGAGEITINVEVETANPPAGARILLDGRELQSRLEPVAGAENRYSVSAPVPNVAEGRHRVRVTLTGSGGISHASEWTFTALQPDANNAYFEETGYFVSQPFLKYWQENGGLALFGYPISDLVQETAEGTEETYTAQYFERARFEQHPSLGDQVILGRLGALLTEPGPPAQPKEGYTFFPETGHNVSPTFLTYWQENGGLALFGYPITEERIEKNPIDGKEYTVQYFERNRFELHPELAGTSFEVQLGLLGAQLYRQEYVP